MPFRKVTSWSPFIIILLMSSPAFRTDRTRDRLSLVFWFHTNSFCTHHELAAVLQHDSSQCGIGDLCSNAVQNLAVTGTYSLWGETESSLCPKIIFLPCPPSLPCSVLLSSITLDFSWLAFPLSFCLSPPSLSLPLCKKRRPQSSQPPPYHHLHTYIPHDTFTPALRSSQQGGRAYSVHTELLPRATHGMLNVLTSCIYVVVCCCRWSSH